MKRVCLLLICALIIVGFSVQPAQAVPEFKKKFDAKYVEGNGNAKFVEAAEIAKCNVCHYGKTKKMRNDYGMALSELLNKENFKAARISADPEGVEKEIFEAFQKVEAMKSSNGKTFAERFKDGDLPGTDPEAE